QDFHLLAAARVGLLDVSDADQAGHGLPPEEQVAGVPVTDQDGSTGLPSASVSGGDRTTRPPIARPLAMRVWPPRRSPTCTGTRRARPSCTTKTTSRPSRRTTASAGTRTPGGGVVSPGASS